MWKIMGGLHWKCKQWMTSKHHFLTKTFIQFTAWEQAVEKPNSGRVLYGHQLTWKRMQSLRCCWEEWKIAPAPGRSRLYARFRTEVEILTWKSILLGPRKKWIHFKTLILIHFLDRLKNQQTRRRRTTLGSLLTSSVRSVYRSKSSAKSRSVIFSNPLENSVNSVMRTSLWRARMKAENSSKLRACLPSAPKKCIVSVVFSRFVVEVPSLYLVATMQNWKKEKTVIRGSFWKSQLSLASSRLRWNFRVNQCKQRRSWQQVRPTTSYA